MKNVTGAACDGRAVPVSLPVTDPPSGAVQNGWVKIDGPAEQHFERDQEKVFVLKFEVSPKDKAKPGKYQVAADFVLVQTPDVGDRSQAFAFTVLETVEKKTHFPLWLIPVLLIVVIGLGVGTWLMLRPHGLKVPDLHGKTLSEAAAALESVGLTLDQNVQTADSKAEDSGKITDQKPDAGQKATKGQQVQVTVGAQMVPVPLLIGHAFQEVLTILGEQKLAVGQTQTAQNPNFAGGVVFNQSPAAQQLVKTGTAVDVQVTPEMVTVQGVIGQNLGNAILILKGLRVTSFSGDTTKTVMSQNPAPGASVPVGSPVTLAFPVADCGGRNCFFRDKLALRVALDHSILAREIQQRKTPPQ